VFIYSRNREKREAFAKTISEELGINIISADDLKLALLQSQLCVTCTSAKHYFVENSFVPAGLLIAAMGADSPDPILVSRAKVVADLKQQSISIGKVHHAIENGLRRGSCQKN
jgi:alanine dehydrogenase